MKHAPSEQQSAIFHWFAKDTEKLIALLAKLNVTDFEVDVEGHLVIRARAGTGKTTTILEAITFAPEERILIAAFNKGIKLELDKRNTNPSAVAMTLHGIGFRQIREFLGNGVRVDEQRQRARGLTDTVAAGMKLPLDILKLITKLHTLARETEPLAKEPGSLLDLMFEQDCEPDPKWRAYGFDNAWLEARALEAMKLAADDMDSIKRTGIDFSDMIYLPIRNNWMAGLYDLVVVDEAQDMTTSQLLLAEGICATGGRIVVVGDDRQAIYGFRGADSNSLDRLKTKLGASELGLNMTYRCGRNIVALAAGLVPDFLCGAPHEGVVDDLRGVPALVAAAEPGDFVLSRKNAPLAGVAIALLRANKRVCITGKDIGTALIALVDKLGSGAGADSVPMFLRKLAKWREKEIERALAQDKEERVEQIVDKAETISALADGVVSVPELKRRFASLFADDGQGAAGRITCSSIHKAKGLEADRVFVLVDTLFPKLPRKLQTAARQREEENLAYVAYTRAKSHLVLVATENLALQPPAAIPQALPLTSPEDREWKQAQRMEQELAAEPPAFLTKADLEPPVRSLEEIQAGLVADALKKDLDRFQDDGPRPIDGFDEFAAVVDQLAAADEGRES